MSNNSSKKLTTQLVVMVGIMGTISSVLMLFEIPAIAFLKLDFSDLPAVIMTMIYGPIYGVLIELIKNILKVIFGTKTGGVGELANFIIGVAYVLPIGLVFRKLKEKTNKSKFILSFASGTISMALVGAIANYIILIPFYAKFFGGEQKIIDYVKVTVPFVQSKLDVCLMVITPFNVVKGILIAIVALPIVYNYSRGKRKYN